MKKDIPVKRRKKPMSGKVVSNRLRRPKVSMVLTAGIANSQLTTPVPSDTANALTCEKPASIKICVLYYSLSVSMISHSTHVGRLDTSS